MPYIKRNRNHGLYFHSSPPKVFAMNNPATKSAFEGSSKEVSNIKPSNIRIWIHERDIGKLTKALWEGHGMRLRTESSNNSRVKKFLEAVPYLMNLIKDIHTAAIDNDVDLLMAKTSPPVPPVLLSARDANGLTALHKAAGLANTRAVEYLLSVWPESATEKDATGKIPLHYAASAKNNDRCFNLLVQAGADEEAQDNRQKAASFYKSKPNELDRSLLSVVPEAPRIPQTPAIDFDWNVINPDQPKMVSSKSQPLSKVANKMGLANNIQKSQSTNAIAAEDDPNNNGDIDPAEDNGDANHLDSLEEMANSSSPRDGNGNDPEATPAAAVATSTAGWDDDEGEEEDGEMEQMVRRKNEMNASRSAESGNEKPVDDNNNEKDETMTALADGDGGGETLAPPGIDNDEWNANEDPDEANNNGGQFDAELDGAEEADDEDDNASVAAALAKEHFPDEPDDDGQGEADDTSFGPQEEYEGAGTDEQELAGDDEGVELNQPNDDSEVVNESETKVEEMANGLAPESEHKEANEQEEVEQQNDDEEEDALVDRDEDVGSNELTSGEKVVEPGEGDVEVQQPEDDDGANTSEAELNNEDKGEEPEATSPPPSPAEPTKEEPSLNSNYVDNDDEYAFENAMISAIDDVQKINDDDEQPDNEGEEPVEKEVEKETAESGSEEEASAPNEANENDAENVYEDDLEEFEAIENEELAEQPEEQEEADVVTLKDAVDDVEGVENEGEEQEEKVEGDENGEDNLSQRNNRSNASQSPSPPLEIEGRVEGEPDNRQTESGNAFEAARGGGGGNGDDIQTIIDRGDMELLAALVLNGEGAQLTGMEAKQPEIQAFLDNVPAYMNKIRRVHLAAREGNLRDLQAALDRRKFAIARDEVSPNGATPLHVATIFGHTGIIRYLAGRFPETTNTLDDNKRSALHYAAVVKDNGHFYNLLVHLGGNSKLVDGWGNSAEFYFHMTKDGRVSEAMSHKSLLHDFGVPESMADEMLSDQVPDDVHSARRSVDDVDVLSTLERCYKIIHESRKQSLSSNPSHITAVTSARISVITNLSRFLKRSIFDDIKHRQTRLDHNLFDVLWPAMKKINKERAIDEDLDVGVVIPDFDCYVVFQEFLVPLVFDMHGLQANSIMELEEAAEMRSISVCSGHNKTMYFPLLEVDEPPQPPQPQLSRPPSRPIAAPTTTASMKRMSQDSTRSANVLNEIRLNLDTTNKFIKACVVECSRNLDDFELPLNLTIGQLEQAERLITGKLLTVDFARAIDEGDELGQYLTMNEILEQSTETRGVLEAHGLMIPILDVSDPQQISESLAINGQFWPYGRGVYISANQTLVVWVNAQEHLRILCCTQPADRGDIGQAYSKCGKAIEFLETRLGFRQSYYLGNLSSRPSFLGTALKFYYTLELPNLMKDMDNLRDLCSARGLQMSARIRGSVAGRTSSGDEGSRRTSNAMLTNGGGGGGVAVHMDSVAVGATTTDGPWTKNLVRVSNRQSMGVNEWQLFMDYCTAVANILQLEKDMSMSNSKHIASMLVNIFRKKRHTLSDINQSD